MSRPVRVDSLKGDLLHLTDRTAIIRDNPTFVDFAYDQRRGLHAGDCIGEDDFAAVSDRLGPTRCVS